ncbi:MAG: cytochrome b [Hydrogenophilales bacterium 16-64-46]|nr:MAG: cytochrome b [Hydrogenophilales bacterium 12-64-13]OYZ05681.1 MAG: cytochrome b [Hydrogenophilales bacterium 16-64-46]OZA40260.1 MAG: cytochrome b [Hydrogenophilales bacterium 17-64-34]HQT00811.1 cytochrome b [Thiobacillus sp.]
MSLRYTAPAVVLHWLIAGLIFIAFPLGVYMSDLPLSPTRLQLYSYHKWIGISVLLLVGLRIVWRLTHRPPALPDDLPRWQRAASHAVHGLLYLLILAVPLTGWLMSSAKGFQTVWFGVLPLPDLVEKNRELGQVLGNAHQFLNYLLLALVILHVVAALKHHFHERRPFLQRMGLGK